MGKSGAWHLFGSLRNLAADSEQEPTARLAHVVLETLPGPAASWLRVAHIRLVTSPSLPGEVAVHRAPPGDGPRAV